MKILVTSTGYYFSLSKLKHRSNVIQDLKNVQDGDMWSDALESILEDLAITEKDLLTVSKETWEEFVDGFVTRGQVQICEL